MRDPKSTEKINFILLDSSLTNFASTLTAGDTTGNSFIGGDHQILIHFLGGGGGGGGGVLQ